MQINNSHRKTRYEEISQKLISLSDIELLKKISEGKNIHTGIGGTSVKLDIDNISVFVKLVPLTDLECQENNLYTTKNIFNLLIMIRWG